MEDKEVDWDGFVADIIAEKRKTIKLLFILCMALLVSLVGTNAYWIWQNGQWEYTTTTEIGKTNGNGTAIISSGEGDVSVGDGSKNSQKQDKSE